MPLKILIGADPELFLRDKTTGKFISAHDRMPGTKLQPHPVANGAVQVDGVAAEFNIDPAASPQQFIENINSVMKSLQGFVGSNIELCSEPVAEFTDEYFRSLPEHVRELGCNPDWNAWTGQVNDKPDSTLPFRTGAGHIHVGFGKGLDPTSSIHKDDCAIIARQLDYYLGMFSLMWDNDSKRRLLYGCAGSFRPKSYGMEYRPLSNVWLRSSKLQTWVYNSAVKAVQDRVHNGFSAEEKFGDRCVDIINNSIRWWDPEVYGKTKEEKEIQMLSLKLGIQNPPPIPKPGEVLKKATDKEIVDKFRSVYGGGEAYAQQYLEAAKVGNTTAIAKIKALDIITDWS